MDDLDRSSRTSLGHRLGISWLPSSCHTSAYTISLIENSLLLDSKCSSSITSYLGNFSERDASRLFDSFGNCKNLITSLQELSVIRLSLKGTCDNQQWEIRKSILVSKSIANWFDANCWACFPRKKFFFLNELFWLYRRSCTTRGARSTKLALQTLNFHSANYTPEWRWQFVEQSLRLQS